MLYKLALGTLMQNIIPELIHPCDKKLHMTHSEYANNIIIKMKDFEWHLCTFMVLKMYKIGAIFQSSADIVQWVR